MASTTTDRRQGVNVGSAVKVPCLVATTANITLEAEQTIDGVALVTDDRVLVKDQTNPIENGIYYVDTGAWIRAQDWDGIFDVVTGTLVYVTSGTTNTGFWYVTTTGTITPGKTSVAIAGASTVLAVISAFAQTLLDDADGDAAIATIVADQTAETAPDVADLISLVDVSLTPDDGRKMTLGNLLKVINTLTAFTAPIVDTDYLALYDAAAAATKKVLLSDLGIASQGVMDFRLSLTTAVPVTTADVTAAGTIYCVPYKGKRIALYDGTRWNVRTSAEFSLALTATSGKPYDVFCYDNAGVPTLETLVWTNDTTRATALIYQDGVLVKTGATTRRYLGTFYASGTDTTEDSIAKRYLWNYYNRVVRTMKVQDATDSWTYSTASFQQANAAATNQLDYVMGFSEDAVTATVEHAISSSGSNEVRIGIGVDSTTVNSAVNGTIFGTSSLNGGSCRYSGYPGVGRHILAWLEYGGGSNTQTWWGDAGGTSFQTGIVGEILA